MAVVQGGESGKQDVGGKQTGSYAQGRSHQSDGSVLLEVDGAGDSPVLDRVSMPPEDSAAVNLRDVHTAAPDILKPGVLWRSSQLVGADQLSKLGLKAVLDLRTIKKTCKKVEKQDLRAQEVEDDTFTKKRLRNRVRAGRKTAHGLDCRPCKVCSAAFSAKYGLAAPVFHADFVPLQTGLKVMGSVPRKTAALAMARLCICQHPQTTMAPATADENKLGMPKLYCLMLDNSQHQVSRALRLWTHSENLPILVHCIHGKDRTGLIVALLLRLIDVPLELVAKDYTQSEQELVSNREEGNLHLDDQLTQDVMLSTREHAVYTVDAHLRERYGGVRSYCRQAGLSDSEIAQIRVNLMVNPTPQDADSSKQGSQSHANNRRQ